MKTLSRKIRSAAAALCAAAFVAAEASAMPIAVPKKADLFTAVASDCYAIGQQVAAQNGGTLAKASQSNRGGQPVCVIVVLVPGKNGQRPRRTEVVVPLG